MRRLALALPFVVAAATASPVLADDAKAPPPAAAAPTVPDWLKDPQAQASYAIGVNIGSQLHGAGIDLSPDMLARGAKDAIAGTPALTDAQVRTALAQLQMMVRGRAEGMAAQAAASNKAAGAAFLKTNGARPGVVTLPDGLQYEIVKAGTGRKPKPTDEVNCNYRGTLIDGAEFDSSYQRGEPTTLPIAGVIPGWAEALQMMPVGSKWKLYIPSDLAYGDEGKPPAIAPGSTLVFEVELVSIAD